MFHCFKFTAVVCPSMRPAFLTFCVNKVRIKEVIFTHRNTNSVNVANIPLGNTVIAFEAKLLKV